MAVTVETLEKLERKITLTLPVNVIQSEVNARLKKMARNVKMDGFRPGKVPMSVVAQRYGYSVHQEVMNEKVGQAFFDAATEAGLRVAGQPSIVEKNESAEGELAFDAMFEVFPDVQVGDLATAEVEKLTAEVTDAAIDKTIDILLKQRRTFALRATDAAAQKGDRVTVDFEGKIDGETFAGGKADDFQFLVGEGQMLKEFEEAVLGMKTGESKTFPLAFPEDYHGKDVAGKTADFMVTIKKIEEAHLPAVDEALVRSLGIEDGTVDALRADIRKSLEREVKVRLLTRNKQAVMDALLAKAELDLPRVSVEGEIDRLREVARAELKERGMKNIENADIPDNVFQAQAERRVRLGLVMGELVRTNDLQPKPEQLLAHVQELAASYEKPEEVVRWYLSDNRRMVEIESMVIDANVTNFVLGKARITEKTVSFDELMNNQG